MNPLPKLWAALCRYYDLVPTPIVSCCEKLPCFEGKLENLIGIVARRLQSFSNYQTSQTPILYKQKFQTSHKQ